MSLNTHLPPSAARGERLGVAQRVVAILGLAGLVLAWAVVLLPCALWLLGSLIVDRLQAEPARQQA